MKKANDYNGTGPWSATAVQARYLELASSLKVRPVRDLAPQEHRQGDRRWIYPVMERVIEGIRAGDAACIELGVQFIDRAGPQPFGKILHSNVARALRKVPLNDTQVERLRGRILGMLQTGDVPREIRDYVRLLRIIGLGPTWPDIARTADRGNPFVRRHLEYIERHVVKD